MKLLRRGNLWVAACILAAGFAAAQSKPASGPAAGTSAALDQLKTLIGAWEGTKADDKPVRISYEVTSGGSALLERLKMADESEMVTLYTADGDRVAVTHYCSAGNQPQMRTEPIAGAATKFTFSFVRVSNLASPTAGHMRQLVITLQDHAHFTQEWTWKENGKTGMELFRFTRKS